jgi:nucleoside-diphosphate kinase
MLRRATVRLGAHVARAGARQQQHQQQAAAFASAAAAGAAKGARSAYAAAGAIAAGAAAASALSWSAATVPMTAMADAAAAASPPPQQQERTFIAVKPDGVERRLIAEVIRRFEQRGYRLAACKVILATREQADEHYAEHRGKPFQPGLVDFLSSGPIVGMVWEGDGVIKQGRAMIGATNPQASAPGTIRGDFGVITSRNLIHGSDSLPAAEREIALWFKPEEIVDFVPTDAKHTFAHGTPAKA